MNRPPVVSTEEWEAARAALLVKEKELTRALDALAAERRRLPMVALDAQKYSFTAPDGEQVGLTGLFDGHRQLVVYHFMLEPGQDWLCGGAARSPTTWRPAAVAPQCPRHPADPDGARAAGGDRGSAAPVRLEPALLLVLWQRVQRRHGPDRPSA